MKLKMGSLITLLRQNTPMVIGRVQNTFFQRLDVKSIVNVTA